jgi:uncharacterized protein
LELKLNTNNLARARTFSQLAGFAIVVLTLVEMFTIPKSYFILGSVVSTSAMICVAYLLSNQTEKKFRGSFRGIALGIGLAVALYGIFLAGNYVVVNLKLFGVSGANEQTIYGLFSGTPPALLVGVLALDAIGFESYFRGNLQNILSKKIGPGAIFLVAIIDAAIHISTLNPLFPATVIVADSVWGLNYYFTKDLYSNIACHFLWDILIFILLPIH